MKSFHIIIDSIGLKTEHPQNCRFYIHEKIPSTFKRIGLKSIAITLDSSMIFKNVYVHCDLLNKDDNLFNGGRSDILAVVANNRHVPKKYLFYQFENCIYKNIKSSDFNSIQLSLTDYNNDPYEINGGLTITYELELIK
jgi:hypothetical protein